MAITRRRTAAAFGTALLAAAGLVLTHAVAADAGPTPATYRVVVTNLMNGEPMSGPVLATHQQKGVLFEQGAPASYGVVQVAENGNNEPLAKQLEYMRTTGQVLDVVDYRRVFGSYPGPVPLSARGLPSSAVFPPVTQPMTITGKPGSRLSWVSMLVCTNDGFTGNDSITLPNVVGRTVTYDAYAYATSTETDNQLLANIMVPCQALTGRHPAHGGAGQNVSTTAAFPGPGTFPDPGTSLSAAQYPATIEGGVIVAHPGLTAGLGDLGVTTSPGPGVPSNYDLFRWDPRLPVSSITVTRVR